MNVSYSESGSRDTGRAPRPKEWDSSVFGSGTFD